MKVEGNISKWGGKVGLGLFIDFQDWYIWHHLFTIGFCFGPWDIGLTITLWDVEEVTKMLQSRGMTEEEAWDFCNEVRGSLPDPYSSRVNMKREIQKALAKEV